jgi:hypothetical protein
MNLRTDARSYWPAGVALSALAMSVGWGVRGDYGHEAGAMIPGALLGLSICIASGRPSWWRRGTIMAACGAIGWAFGGQMSYGRITGYTASLSLPDVAYGYASLFVVGGLWAGIGAAVLALSVTQPRSYLERFAGPLVVMWLLWVAMDFSGLTKWMVDTWYLNDTDWFRALPALVVAGACGAIFPRWRPACALIALLALGWLAGYILLTALLGLHMTPPRSDNWSGCIGLFVTLLVYLHRRRDRVAFTLALWGLLAGGVGFAVGDFVNMLGRAQWGPIGHYKALQGLDYWKWMEQLFGLIMGLAVGWVFLRRVRSELEAPEEDEQGRNSNTVALLFLLVVMMWSNLFKNVRNWARRDHIPDGLFGIGAGWWFLWVGLILSAVVVIAIARHRRNALALAPYNAFGRAQLLFLIVLWIPIVGAFVQAFPGMAGKGIFFVHTTFWITAGVCSLIVLALPGRPESEHEPQVASADSSWKLGLKYWLCWLLVPVLIGLLAHLTISSHKEPLFGSHLRFAIESQQ